MKLILYETIGLITPVALPVMTPRQKVRAASFTVRPQCERTHHNAHIDHQNVSKVDKITQGKEYTVVSTRVKVFLINVIGQVIDDAVVMTAF